MGDTRPIYAVPVNLPGQRDLIPGCFDCGQIVLGVLMDPELGELSVCRAPKEACPQLDRQMDTPIAEYDGDPVYLRKLKAAAVPEGR
jgi:hypothetical protein